MTTAADLLTARQVANNYRAMSDSLEREAASRKLRNMPLSSRVIRQWAFIARNAARAEEWPDIDRGR